VTKIKGIAEIVLNVHDVEASLKFYQEVLGLEIMGRPGPVFLRAGDPAVSVPQMVVLVPLPPNSDPFSRPRPLHHLALELAPEDFEAEKPASKPWGIKFAPASTRSFPLAPCMWMTRMAMKLNSFAGREGL